MYYQEAQEEYVRAMRLGQREYRARVAAGENPYPQVLDTLLEGRIGDSVQQLGVVKIPAERIVGVKSSGRTNAFAANFMPLLPEESEFAGKWCKLCEAHLSDEGIRDAVSCYEYMGRFYVQEGNKRVSVMKFFGATAIPAQVIRILPTDKTSPEGRAYAEFLGYYARTGL